MKYQTAFGEFKSIKELRNFVSNELKNRVDFIGAEITCKAVFESFIGTRASWYAVKTMDAGINFSTSKWMPLDMMKNAFVSDAYKLWYNQNFSK